MAYHPLVFLWDREYIILVGQYSLYQVGPGRSWDINYSYLCSRRLVATAKQDFNTDVSGQRTTYLPTPFLLSISSIRTITLWLTSLHWYFLVWKLSLKLKGCCFIHSLSPFFFLCVNQTVSSDSQVELFTGKLDEKSLNLGFLIGTLPLNWRIRAISHFLNVIILWIAFYSSCLW